MKRGLYALIAAAGLTAAAAASAGWLFLAKPGWILTGSALKRAAIYFGLNISERGLPLRLSAESLGARRHRYDLVAADACVNDSLGRTLCFEAFELRIVVRYSWRGPALERVERFVVSAPEAKVDLRKPRPGAASGFDAARWLSIPVDLVRVDLPGLAVSLPGKTLSGDFTAVLEPDRRVALSVAADLLLAGPSGRHALKGSLTAGREAGPVKGPLSLTGSASWDLGNKAAFHFTMIPEGRRVAVSGGAEFGAASKLLPSVRLTACGGSTLLSPSDFRPANARLECRIELSPGKGSPDAIAMNRPATGTVSMTGLRGGGRYFADITAGLATGTSWYSLTADLNFETEGRLDRPWSEGKARYSLKASARTARFQRLVSYLNGTKAAVPAPFHVLDGPLSATLHGGGDPRANAQSIDGEVNADLAGSRQRLKLRSSWDLAIANAFGRGRSFELDGSVDFDETALELPRLDVGRMPRLKFDARISSGVASAPEPPGPARVTRRAWKREIPFRVRVRGKTLEPLILYSNLAKSPIPVVLDVAAAYPPGTAEGAVSVRSFGIELFRRSATVDHLNVSLSSATGEGDLEGLIVYKTPDAVVNILLLGTTKEPRVEFTSVPPMTRDDILSLLIFGKSPEELDRDKTESVGNMRTALDNRAFGLTSLYLFGTTPVERVGYDSASKTTTIKLRLPTGAKLMLDSDFDQNRGLRLRKSLSAHWSIQSEVNEQDRSVGAATFLEWFKQY